MLRTVWALAVAAVLFVAANTTSNAAPIAPLPAAQTQSSDVTTVAYVHHWHWRHHWYWRHHYWRYCGCGAHRWYWHSHYWYWHPHYWYWRPYGYWGWNDWGWRDGWRWHHRWWW